MSTENSLIDADSWISCDDGIHLILMDESNDHYGWVFRKVKGGWPYSLRKATEHEMAHARARQHLRAGVKHIEAESQPSPQPHAEPIAWMVGTAFWWTKEEAERDAAETGLPIVSVGPITGSGKPAEQNQGDPAMWANDSDDTITNELRTYNLSLGGAPATAVGRYTRPLYACADPKVRWEAVAGEQMRVIEQLKAELGEAKGEYDRSANKVAAMVAQMAERDALLHKLKETIQREYWDEYAGLDETRELIDAALTASQEPSTPAAPYPNRLCHIDYTAHPYRCGCLKGDEEAQRRYDEHCRAASAEPETKS